jgi:dihydroorotate dehydrogenase
MYNRIRPLLFHLDPEEAHRLTLAAVSVSGGVLAARLTLRSLYDVNDPRLVVEAFGLKFKNPIGLAAGYDKNGVAVGGLSTLGFGHIEVGTITPRPQTGNPRPRLHRLPEAKALINSLGFPNLGADAIEGEHWRRQARGARVGVNIGKGKDTPLERAAEDYVFLLRRYHAHADYVTINVSSPNTLGLRQLQTKAFILELLTVIAQERAALTPRVPILVKIAPDLTEAEIDDVLDAIASAGIDGIIATNTTLSRQGVPAYARELKGGLSGQPLKARATAVIRYIAQRTGGKLPIIGVGGVASARDALEKLQAGARLIQVYTGLIYSGPGLIHDINLGLLKAIRNGALQLPIPGL